jgi:hypothetical protein
MFSTVLVINSHPQGYTTFISLATEPFKGSFYFKFYIFRDKTSRYLIILNFS